MLSVVPVCLFIAIVILATGTDPAGLGFLALLAIVFLGGCIVTTVVSASGGRTRYAALREAVGADGVAVRSTAWIEDGQPVAASDNDDARKPGRRHQLLTFTPDGIELRERPIGGRGGATLLPYTGIDSVEVGTATFNEWTDRAVLIAGRVEGKSVELGVVPVDAPSFLLSPVTDATYRALIERIVACAETAERPSPRWSSNRGDAVGRRG